MNVVTTVREAVSGYKTYGASAVSVVYGVYQLTQQHKWQAIVPYLLAGAFGAFIRAAVAKVEAKLPAPVDAVVNNAAGITVTSKK